MCVLTANTFSDDESRWQAVCERDAEADGHFVYGVISTGIYCLPSCPSKRAKLENVRFFDTTEEALNMGLRACLRCQPDRPNRHTELIAKACRIIEENDASLRVAELSLQLGVSRHHFQRLFKRITGVSPKAYQQAIRRRAAEQSLKNQESVTRTVFDSGHASTSRFYAGVAKDLGMQPAKRKRGALGQVITYATTHTELGQLLVARTERGICAVLFGDDRTQLLHDLKDRFPKATFCSDDNALKQDLVSVVECIEHPTTARNLPLDIQGTAFQQQVWSALREIPAGKTQSYSEVAKRIGKPGASRAVAGACAANPLAVLVPCHRVVRSDGGLSGYRWGIDRKKELLDREKKKDDAWQE